LLIRGQANIEPGVVVAGFLDPDGRVAVDGLAVWIGCDVASDIDGDESMRSKSRSRSRSGSPGFSRYDMMLSSGGR
jgi:hypothetical protein